MEPGFSSLITQKFSLKKFLIFFLKKPALRRFLIFSSLILPEMELSYIQNPSIFRTRSILRTLGYLEPETYSEHRQKKATYPTFLCFKKKLFSLTELKK